MYASMVKTSNDKNNRAATGQLDTRENTIKRHQYRGSSGDLSEKTLTTVDETEGECTPLISPRERLPTDTTVVHAFKPLATVQSTPQNGDHLKWIAGTRQRRGDRDKQEFLSASQGVSTDDISVDDTQRDTSKFATPQNNKELHNWSTTKQNQRAVKSIAAPTIGRAGFLPNVQRAGVCAGILILVNDCEPPQIDSPTCDREAENEAQPDAEVSSLASTAQIPSSAATADACSSAATAEVSSSAATADVSSSTATAGVSSPAATADTSSARRLNRRWKLSLVKKAAPLKINSKVQLLKKYRLHIFVFAIFFITLLSVSLSWHFRNMAQEQIYASQAIFFNPRTRELTLADPTSTASVRGRLGVDIPYWMLPLHCPIVSNGDPHYKECLWKNSALLRIVHFQGTDVQCYNISWKSLDPTYAPHDCYYINNERWYGPSNRSARSFPISGEFKFQPKKNYTLSSNGMFNTVVDFYWISSSGAGIYVDANNPIQLTWNVTGDNQLCITSNFSGPLYHKTNAFDYPDMSYTLCNGKDTRTTHEYMQKLLAPNHKLIYPPLQVLQGTHWSLKGYAGTDKITEDHVLDLLNNITNNGFLDNQITLDGKWQKAHGNLNLIERFPKLINTLTSYNTSLTVCVSPYFQYSSGNFDQGILDSFFVKDAGGEVTGLTNFQGELTAILDVFATGARQWYIDKLQNITGVTSYRLTYGDQSWLPYKPHFSDVDATPNMYRKLVTETVASLENSSIVVEHTSDSRHVTSIIPVVSVVRLVEGNWCITDVIETALTLGLMGYPFVMADGIRTDKEVNNTMPLDSNLPSREVYMRWLQLSSLFPAYQFSTVPWVYGPEVISAAKQLSAQRREIILPEITDQALQDEVANGDPILRPVWWLDAGNRTVHDMEITDEFLIGNNLLVAPVLCEGIKNRDIYFPRGVWEDLSSKAFILGPTILKDYNVTEERIPMFKRRPIAGEPLNADL